MLFIFEKQENSQIELLQIFLKIEVHFEQIRIGKGIDNFKTMHVDKNQFMKMASSKPIKMSFKPTDFLFCFVISISQDTVVGDII